MLDKQLTLSETMQQVTQLLVVDGNWLGILKSTDHYKIKIIRMLHPLKWYNKDTTQTKLLEYWEQLLFPDKTGACLPKECYYHSQESLALPRAPGFLPWSQGVSLKLPGSDPRPQREDSFFRHYLGSKGSGGKSETCRTTMILKSLIIFVFQI